MKRALWIVLALSAVAASAACGAALESPAAAGALKKDPPNRAEQPLAENPAPSGGPLSPAPEEEARRLAFGKALWDVYQRGALPDGKPLEYHTLYSMEAAASNRFALADADGDGQEELLLLWEASSMAGMGGYVFGYKDGAVYEELSAFPSLRFYDNGIVEEDSSHNQNLAGDFWPYFVHQYDAESGVYQRLGGVDAWDKRVREENAEGDIWPLRFPAAVDADGDGILYWILPADWDGYYNHVPMVDGSDYESWRSAYLDGAKEISLPLRTLTAENIAALGAPMPDVQFPVPAG